jgi:hypothetical protein
MHPFEHFIWTKSDHDDIELKPCFNLNRTIECFTTILFT